MRYTTAELAAEITEQARLRELIATTAEQIADCTDGDGNFSGTAAEQRFEVLNAQHVRAEASLRRVSEQVDRMSLWHPVDSRPREESVMNRFLRGGANGITAEELKELEAGGRKVGLPQGLPDHSISMGLIEPGPQIQAAAAASDASAWSTLLRHETRWPIVETVAAFGGHQRMVSRFSTGDGNPLPIAQEDDSTQKGERMAQGATINTQDIADPTNVLFGATSYNSKWITWTREMAQDSGFDLEAWVRRRCSVRLGRIVADDTFSGTGVSQPHGIATIAKAALTSAASGKIEWEDMMGLIYEINRAYREMRENLDGAILNAGGTPLRMGPGAGGETGFLISDDMEMKARTWKDSDGRPLLLPSIREGMPRTIGGESFRVSMNMPTVAAGNKPVIYGAFWTIQERIVETVEFFPFFDSGTVPSYKAVAFARVDQRSLLPLTGGKSPAIVSLTVKA